MFLHMFVGQKARLVERERVQRERDSEERFYCLFPLAIACNGRAKDG